MSELKGYNLQLLILLDEKEIFGVAKSIAKWTKSKFSKGSFGEYVVKTLSPEIQSIRGKKSKGEGRPKIRNNEWVKLGISRSSWYRKYK